MWLIRIIDAIMCIRNYDGKGMKKGREEKISILR